MIHSVPFDKLPADFRVPEDLQSRCWYDAGQRRFCFDGFMSKATYDRLKLLHADTGYQDALHDLFCLCVPESNPVGPVSQSSRWWLRLGGAAVVLGMAGVALVLALL